MLIHLGFLQRAFLASLIALFPLGGGAETLEEWEEPLEEWEIESLIPRSEPHSSFIEWEDAGTNSAFCAAWNPDFAFKGSRCCGKPVRRRGPKCSPARAKNSYCDEMTEGQREYIRRAESNEYSDVLELIELEIGSRGNQAFCSPNNGFLAWGRPVLPSVRNAIALRRPDRCVNFGTDRMVALLEWAGREIKNRYPLSPEVRLLVGDVSAPRGGCLAGRGGYRGHASHTTGQDADLGFLTLNNRGRSPQSFQSKFDPEPNWWFLKQVFSNPYACVKVVFLDRKHIAKLAKVASGTPEWEHIRPYIRHVRNHKNHFHVRVGDEPGPPGCY